MYRNILKYFPRTLAAVVVQINSGRQQKAFMKWNTMQALHLKWQDHRKGKTRYCVQYTIRKRKVSAATWKGRTNERGE